MSHQMFCNIYWNSKLVANPLACFIQRVVVRKQTEEKENNAAKITLLAVDMLKPYCKHLFKPYSDDKLRELMEDIRENGILSPVYVSPCAGAYEILSGHNRTEAAKLAGLAEIPCIIKDCDDDTAALIVVNNKSVYHKSA